MAPGGLPEAIPRAEPLIVTFFAPFLGLLGGSWGALGRLLARLGAVLAPLGSLLGPPGALLGLMLASRGTLFGDFETAESKSRANLAKIVKMLILRQFFWGFSRFLEVPGGPTSSQNRSKIALGSLLAPLGAS